jgi:hypothetical protein
MLSIELLRYDREPHDKPEPPAEPASVIRRESMYRSSDAARSLRSGTLDPESVTVGSRAEVDAPVGQPCGRSWVRDKTVERDCCGR